MHDHEVIHPSIASRSDWLAARKALLEREKALTREMDAVNAARRRLPMVRLDKPYAFDGPNGKTRLLDLFEGRRQLIIYHFMFDPEWEKGCGGCTGLVKSLGDLSLLGERNTSFALVSRAPLAKIEAYKADQGWRWPWVSSYGSDFNYDFHVTLDSAIAPPQYNYRGQAELESRCSEEPHFTKGECHGLSVFFHLDGEVFHTYSTYARGCESLTDAYALLDRTPYGRQEDFEDSPQGWPQRPTYG
ncbi:DUF899 domain-containing protein [Halomonas sp. ML-15]|uniref:DUF899 domain-containing protein n=1 Tax=Halomonas sp. ML-15 TaxID=2773305 RepID=UPI00174761F3|nr:DUF899 domain-containing protein [Halomonas sp. ML-15]MBD3897277.1 DUF899 domain-containing protein [Halomonas sp. ML-15]